MKEQKSWQKKRLRILCWCSVLCTIAILGKLVYLSVLSPVMDADAKAQLTSLKRQAKEDVTIPGNFYDRNGVALTSSETPGEDGVLLYPESTSLLLGYHDDRFGSSGLRNTCEDTIYLDGKDVALTLDIRWQEYALHLLPEDSSAIILDNDTGEILCLAGRGPVELDFNDVEASMEAANLCPGSLLLRGVSEQDPPGSVFKILTSAAAFEKAEQQPGSISFTYNDDEPFLVPRTDQRIHNYDDRSWGELTIEEAFTRSSNTFFANLACQTGPEFLDTIYRQAFLGEVIELDFCVLQSTLPDVSQTTELVQASFGQGALTITPMHLATIVSSFFTADGIMRRPYILQNTGSARLSQERLCSADAAQQVRNLLSLSARAYGLESALGAKTGTAQCTGGRLHTYLAAADEACTYLISCNDGSSSTDLIPIMRDLMSFCQTNNEEGGGR